MPDRVENLWPAEFLQVTDPEPIAFLKEQAKLLREMTQGRVVGTVRENVVKATVYHSLYLRNAGTTDYRSLIELGEDYGFKILHVAHSLTKDAADPFPVEAQDSFGGVKVSISNMDEFKEWLKNVLSSNNVVAVIGNLLRAAKKPASP